MILPLKLAKLYFFLTIKILTCSSLDTVSNILPNATSLDTILLNIEKHWADFKNEYNKSYASIHHERKALEAWKTNLVLIHAHNALGHSYKLHANNLSDLSLKDYLKQVVKLIKSHHYENDYLTKHPLRDNEDEVPEEVDWRKSGFNPIVVSQKRCGACYAFTAAHALQAQLYIAKSLFIPLSEQQIVDCSGSFGNYGCGGGSLRGAFKYLDSYGAMSALEYPYEAKKGKCQWNALLVKTKPTSWGLVPKNDEVFLERAVALAGPVAVSLNAAPNTFQLYHSGVYDDDDCTDEHVNHAVLVVGYTKSYWIVLNWWGPTWGESGYMKIKKGINRCGISNFAAFVIIE